MSTRTRKHNTEYDTIFSRSRIDQKCGIKVHQCVYGQSKIYFDLLSLSQKTKTIQRKPLSFGATHLAKDTHSRIQSYIRTLVPFAYTLLFQTCFWPNLIFPKYIPLPQLKQGPHCPLSHLEPQYYQMQWLQKLDCVAGNFFTCLLLGGQQYIDFSIITQV